jgi:uncharacterized protein
MRFSKDMIKRLMLFWVFAQTTFLVAIASENGELTKNSLLGEIVVEESLVNEKQQKLPPVVELQNVVENKLALVPNESKDTIELNLKFKMEDMSEEDLMRLMHLIKRGKVEYSIKKEEELLKESVSQLFSEKIERLSKLIDNECSKSKVRILSLDGGGIRGYLEALFLEELEKRAKKPICQLFDLIVATSTGTIIAAGLTIPDKSESSKPAYTASDIVKMYVEKASDIFGEKNGAWFRGPKYLDNSMIKLFEQKFGKTTLSNTLTPILLTKYNLTEKCGEVYSTFDAKINPSVNYLLPEVVRSCVGAPSYFNPYMVGKKIIADGGLFANNPTLLGFIEACHHFEKWPHEIYQLSLGTGVSPNIKSLEDYQNYSKLDWAGELLDVFLDGSSQHFMAKKLYDSLSHKHAKEGGMGYDRVQFTLKKEQLELDNISKKNFELLAEAAQNTIQQWDSRLNEIVKILTSEPEEKKNIL